MWLIGNVLVALVVAAAPAFDMVIQTGHQSMLNGIAASPDGTLVASASEDGSARIWSSDGRLLRILEHKEAVNALVFLADSRTLLTAGGDGVVRTFDVRANKVTAEFKAHDHAITTLALSADEQRVLLGSKDGHVYLFTRDGKRVRAFDDDKAFYCEQRQVVFSPDGKQVAAASLNLYGRKTLALRVWDAQSGQLVRDFDEQSASFNTVVFAKDATWVATGSGYEIGTRDNAVRISRLDGTLLVKLPCNGIVRTLALSRDGGTLYAGTEQGTIYAWRDPAAGGKPVLQLAAHDTALRALRLSPDGSRLYSASSSFFGEGSALKTWRTGGDTLRFERGFRNHLGGITDLAFSPDGQKLAAAMSYPDKAVAVYDLTARLDHRLTDHTVEVTALSWSKFGFASASRDSSVQVYAPGGEHAYGVKHGHVVYGVAMSPDGELLASAAADGELRIWPRAEPGKGIRRDVVIEKKNNNFYKLAFSPDSQALATVNQIGKLQIWDRGGQPLAESEVLDADGLSTVFWPTPDELLLSSSAQSFRATYQNGALAVTKLVPGRMVAVSNDGKLLAVTGGKKREAGFDVLTRDGKRLEHVAASGYAAAFSPDARLLAIGSWDGTITLVRRDSGAIVTMRSDGDQWLAYTPDGYFDASRGGAELVQMVQGLDAYSVTQFALTKNRPDILIERLGTGGQELLRHYQRQYEHRLQRAGIDAALVPGGGLPLHVPDAAIDALDKEAGDARIGVRCQDSQEPLQSFSVFMNGVSVKQAPISGKTFSDRVRLPLEAGDNVIEVSCTNRRGAESFRARRSLFNETQNRGVLYVAALGVSKYKDQRLELGFADADARAIVDWAKKQQGAKTLLITNEDGTRDAPDVLQKFFAAAGVDDSVLLFVAGHGVHDDDAYATYYFLSHEADTGKLASTAIPYERLEGIITQSAARKRLLLLDSCESGEREADAAGVASAPAPAPTAAGSALVSRAIRLKRAASAPARDYLLQKDRLIYADLTRRNGAIALSSSRGSELSFESSALGHGLFTDGLLGALSAPQSDKNGDGQLDARELERAVAERVAKASADVQHPVLDRDNPLSHLALPVGRAQQR